MEQIFHCLLTYVQFTCTSQKTSNCGKNKSTDDFPKSLDIYTKIRNETDTQQNGIYLFNNECLSWSLNGLQTKIEIVHMELTVRKKDRPSKAIQGILGFWTGAPNENMVQNHLNISLKFIRLFRVVFSSQQLRE